MRQAVLSLTLNCAPSVVCEVFVAFRSAGPGQFAWQWYQLLLQQLPQLRLHELPMLLYPAGQPDPHFQKSASSNSQWVQLSLQQLPQLRLHE